MRDCTEVHCYWAGFLVIKYPVSGMQEQEDLIESIRERLCSGKIIFSHTGVIHTLTELCIDGVKDGESFRLCDLKK